MRIVRCRRHNVFGTDTCLNGPLQSSCGQTAFTHRNTGISQGQIMLSVI